MTHLPQRLMTALAIFVAAPVLAEPVTIADAGYATQQGSAFIVKTLLEQQLGTETKIVPATSVPVIWEALNRNKGEIDVWTDVWLPNQQGLVSQYTGNGKNVTLTANSYLGGQGYCTLTKTADKYDIHSVYDLTDPEKAKVFAAKGSDQGQIWLGAPGWLSTNYEEIRARDYGFAPFFNLVRSDEAVATANLDNADKTDGAWIGYCYSPHQNYARYKLTNLTEPAHDPATWVTVEGTDPQWLAKSKIGSGYQDAAIHIAYTKHFADNNPQGVKIIEAIEFTTQDINELAYAIAVQGLSPEQAAQQWVSKNQKRVAGWLAKS
ncbi:glycine betaine ABC transporter substrate-binding protein [Klebsiella sp. BIGb0407]|uniref:glycine betaine ABC transporter substrate-binding protein n=1 Tax=Klebsiella sp. BIGb0407 TaxID=2940603 RepID=UPI002166DB3D|nr:glycine betaine ABC transporter substrate-binding protein [Klebsiella sp. BIGb0407]MCS3432289.1 glycine betaine/proline transport system substrate-binding protein [Klebsiella sp. BIGb0407]